MKARLTSMVMALLMTFCASTYSEDAIIKEAFHLDTTFFESVAFIPHDELQLNPSGYICGSEYSCIYSSSSYCILKNDNTIYKRRTIEHPNIEKNAPYINHVLVREDTFYFLVIDHSIGSSYVLAETIGVSEPCYGPIIESELYKFSNFLDGFACIGRSHSGYPTMIYIKQDGCVVWRTESDILDTKVQACCLFNNNLCTILQDNYQAALHLTMWDEYGTAVLEKTISLENSPISFEHSRCDVYQLYVDNKDLIIAGQQVSNTDKTCAFYFRVDSDLQVISVKVLNNWSRISSVTSLDDNLLFLVSSNDEMSSNFKYLITEDESLIIPLEQRYSGITSLSVGKNQNSQNYLFGSVFPDGETTRLSAFIAIIK